jgi:hypothetical protein
MEKTPRENAPPRTRGWARPTSAGARQLPQRRCSGGRQVDDVVQIRHPRPASRSSGGVVRPPTRDRRHGDPRRLSDRLRPAGGGGPPAWFIAVVDCLRTRAPELEHADEVGDVGARGLDHDLDLNVSLGPIPTLTSSTVTRVGKAPVESVLSRGGGSAVTDYDSGRADLGRVPVRQGP